MWPGQAQGQALGGEALGQAGREAPERHLLRLCCPCSCSMVGEAWWRLRWLQVQSRAENTLWQRQNQQGRLFFGGPAQFTPHIMEEGPWILKERPLPASESHFENLNESFT